MVMIEFPLRETALQTLGVENPGDCGALALIQSSSSPANATRLPDHAISVQKNAVTLQTKSRDRIIRFCRLKTRCQYHFRGWRCLRNRRAPAWGPYQPVERVTLVHNAGTGEQLHRE